MEDITREPVSIPYAGAGGPQTRLLIVSRVRLLREGLASILSQRPRVDAVCSAAGVDSTLRLVRSFEPTLILLDISTEDGLQTARGLAEAAAGVPVLGFAARAGDDDVVAYAQAGVTGFIAREASTDEMFDSIERAAAGELLCSPRVAAALFRQLAALAIAQRTSSEPAVLTGRERQVVRLIDDGLSNKAIARELAIEVSTVKNHVHNILDKLQVTRRGQAAARMRDSSMGRLA